MIFYDRRELFCPRILSFCSGSRWCEAHFIGKPKKGLPEKRKTRISWDLLQAKPKMETQGKHFDLVFREIVTYFRHLETTPFCPADIFPREGARSYHRMGIIAIIFSAPASPLPLHGECRRDRRPEGESQRVGDLLQLDELLRIKGSLFCFFRWRKQLPIKNVQIITICTFI